MCYFIFLLQGKCLKGIWWCKNKGSPTLPVSFMEMVLLFSAKVLVHYHREPAMNPALFWPDIDCYSIIWSLHMFPLSFRLSWTVYYPSSEYVSNRLYTDATCYYVYDVVSVYTGYQQYWLIRLRRKLSNKGYIFSSFRTKICTSVSHYHLLPCTTGRSPGGLQVPLTWFW